MNANRDLRFTSKNSLLLTVFEVEILLPSFALSILKPNMSITSPHPAYVYEWKSEFGIHFQNSTPALKVEKPTSMSLLSTIILRLHPFSFRYFEPSNINGIMISLPVPATFYFSPYPPILTYPYKVEWLLIIVNICFYIFNIQS